MSDLFKRIKADIVTSMKQKDEVKKTILRVVVSNLENKLLNKITDETVIKVMENLVSLNEDLLLKKENPTLLKENEILKTYIPQKLSSDEIKQHLLEIEEKIKSEKDDGRTIGLAIDYLKSKKLTVDGKVVAKIVSDIRNN